MSDINITVTPSNSVSVSAGVGTTSSISAGSLAIHADSHLSGGRDAINHNNLYGLQGGSSSERYHLTKEQYDSLGGDGSFDFVSLTGNQTISGEKTFLYGITTPYISLSSNEEYGNAKFDFSNVSGETIDLVMPDSLVLNDSLFNTVYLPRYSGELLTDYSIIDSGTLTIGALPVSPYDSETAIATTNLYINDALNFKYSMVYSGGSVLSGYNLYDLHEKAYNANAAALNNTNSLNSLGSSVVYLTQDQNISGVKTFVNNALFSSNVGIGTNTPTSKLDISDTWNSAGTTFTGVKLNITDTASSASSLLMDLRVGGVSRFNVRKDGTISFKAGANTADISSDGAGRVLISASSTAGARINGDLQIGGTSTILLQDGAANTLAMRNGTGLNPQTFRLYNTYTDTSNYERGFFRWNTNVLQMGTEAAGTGSLRNMEINCNSLTLRDNTNTSANFYISNGNGSSNLYLDNIGNSNSGNILFKDRDALMSTISISKVNGVDKHNFTLSIRNNGYINITDNILSIGNRLIGNINEIYFNNVTDNSSSAPAVIAINGGYGKTTFANVAGGNIVLAGGKGIGSGLGGDIIFQTTPNVAAANTLQTLTTAMTIKGNGNVGIGNSSPTATLDIARTWNSNITVTGASGNGTTATLTFAQQTTVIPVGATIVVASVNPSGYNGTYTVTASTTTSVSYANATTTAWVSGGTIQQLFAAIKADITDTASNSGSLLMDLRVGGNSKFKVDKAGKVGIGNAIPLNDGVWLEGVAYELKVTRAHDNSPLLMASGVSASVAGRLGIGPLYNASTPQVFLYLDDTNTLGQRNSTNAQTFRLYNTYTDASNYERGFFRWNSNVLEVGTEKLGTGAARNLNFQTDGTSRWTIDTAGRLVSQGHFGVFSMWQGGFHVTTGGTNTIARFYGDSGHTRILSYETSLCLEIPRLTFNGTTSAFPALKRVGATIAVRLADDSADAALSCSSITASGTIKTNNELVISNSTYLNNFYSDGSQIAAPYVLDATNNNILHNYTLRLTVTDTGSTAINSVFTRKIVWPANQLTNSNGMMYASGIVIVKCYYNQNAQSVRVRFWNSLSATWSAWANATNISNDAQWGIWKASISGNYMTELEVETTSNSTNSTNIVNIEYYPTRNNEGIKFPSLFAMQGADTLLFGGGRSNHVSLKRNNTTLEVKLGDDSNFAQIAAGSSLTLYNTYTSATNFERLNVKYNSTATAFQIGTEKGSAGGAIRPLEFQTDGTTRVSITATGTIGVWAFGTFAGTAILENSSSAYLKSNGNLSIGGTNSIVFRYGAGQNLGWTIDVNGHFRHYGSGTGTLDIGSSSNLVRSVYTTNIYAVGGSVGIGTTSPESKLTVTGGDAEVTDSASGVILKSPDGTRYRITVANGGTLTVTAV